MRSWLAALIAFAAVLGTQGAHAHASLVSSDPAHGASLDAPPVQLVLRFDEPVKLVQARLVDAAGRTVATDAARSEGSVLAIATPQGLAKGSYLLSYRVVSGDSHVVGGSILFSLGQPATELEGTPVDTLAASASAVALRALRDAALLAAAGMALFVLFVASFAGERRILAGAGIAAASLSLVSIWVHGTLLSEDPGVMQAWSTAVGTSYGASALVAAAGSVSVALGAYLEGGRRSVALGLGAALCAASLSLTGHAAVAQPRWLASTAIVVHGLAGAFWFGSLLALQVMLRRDADHAAPALQRFSSIAVWAVPALLAAGTAFAVIQLDSPLALASSAYGRLILLKAGLLAALLVLASVNRFVWVPRLAQGEKAAIATLRWTIAAEIVLVVAVLAATALLVQTKPTTALSTSLDAKANTAGRGPEV